MLYSRAGDYPPGQPLLYTESFSQNTAEGACPKCHGLGRIYEVTEKSMVPDSADHSRARRSGLANSVARAESSRHSGIAGIRRRQTVARAAQERSELDSVYRRAADRAGVRGTLLETILNINVDIPLGVFTSVTGFSGSGKSSLVSQVLVDLVAGHLGQETETEEENDHDELARAVPTTVGGGIVGGMEGIRRMVRVDQKPIGRTPRSNMATYTGLFDHVRRLFAATRTARARRYDAGRFSFNVAKGRCETCSGEGSVCVELLFLPSVYAPCPACYGARFNAKTLEITYRDNNIADVLRMTVDRALSFFAEEPQVHRALTVLSEVGLGYLRLGQPATELSGGEAQRIKLATELQRTQHGTTIYILDEPTTGLHPSDVERLMTAR